jgi:hypothetical protein
MMQQEGEVYFLKLNNGEDLLCMLVGDEPDCLYVTQPYRVEAMQSPSNMVVTTAIMRWIPFENMMTEKIRLDKSHIMTYMLVDDEVAEKYLNSINKESRSVRQMREEEARRLVSRALSQAIINNANNSSGTIH